VFRQDYAQWVLARALAVVYWLWAAFVGLVAGWIGAVLSCEEGCATGSPPLLRPWQWDDYDVAGRVFAIGALGFAMASVFAVAVLLRRPWLGAGCLAGSVVLLSYPFFAGLTASGRSLLAFGPVLGIAALLTARSGPTRGVMRSRTQGS
jgi:hypothetical protein